MSIDVTWEEGKELFPRLYWRLDDQAYEVFQQYGVLHEIGPGQTVFRRGDPSPSLYLVFEGELAAIRKDREIARVGPNHSFGEMGFLLDAPRSATARTTRPTRLIELTREGLQRMQEEAPVWSCRLYRVLAECLAEYLQATPPLHPALT